jgi:hypothetical protein
MKTVLLRWHQEHVEAVAASIVLAELIETRKSGLHLSLATLSYVCWVFFPSLRSRLMQNALL